MSVHTQEERERKRNRMNVFGGHPLETYAAVKAAAEPHVNFAVVVMRESLVAGR